MKIIYPIVWIIQLALGRLFLSLKTFFFTQLNNYNNKYLFKLMCPFYLHLNLIYVVLCWSIVTIIFLHRWHEIISMSGNSKMWFIHSSNCIKFLVFSSSYLYIQRLSYIFYKEDAQFTKETCFRQRKKDVCKNKEVFSCKIFLFCSNRSFYCAIFHCKVFLS